MSWSDHAPIAPAAAVFLGGTVGSALRLLLAGGGGPWLTATFLTNVVACLVIGVLLGTRDRWPSILWPFAAIGVCGGLSTFSGFALELYGVLEGGGISRAAVMAAAEIGTGLLALVIGERMASAIGRHR